jgi:hypothetical protein
MSSINLESKIPAGQLVIASSIHPSDREQRIMEIACVHFHFLPTEIKNLIVSFLQPSEGVLHNPLEDNF